MVKHASKILNFVQVGFNFESQVKYHNNGLDLVKCKFKTVVQVTKIKYLGILKDNKITWKSIYSVILRVHINKLFAEIRK